MSTVFAQVTDLKGHWAEQQVSAWVTKGLAGGYEDGTFRPDNNITRAEFVALLNRAFKVTKTGPIDFTDVKATDWYAGEVAAAKVAGYIGGYEDKTFRPDNPITREEVASILTRYLNLTSSQNLDSLKKFQDAPSDWSKAAVDAVAAKAVMGGYPDKTFKAQNPISRAEAVVTLDRAIALTVVVVPPTPTQQLVYDKAGTYGPETGNQTLTGDVTISVADVTLRNTVITGNLTLTEGIGDGNVYLNNVTVKGKTIVNGGGSHSIVVTGSNLGAVEVNKPNVHIEVAGNSVIVTVTVNVGGVSVTGNGVQTVTIAQTVPAGTPIVLNGQFGQVTVAGNASVNVQGTVATLTIGNAAAGANITLAQGSVVTNLIANAAASVSGQGQIQTATINANGANIAVRPGSIVVASGVTATVGGSPVTGTTPPSTDNGNTSGGGGGGGGGTVTTTPKISYFNGQAISGSATNISVKLVDLSRNTAIRITDDAQVSMNVSGLGTIGDVALSADTDYDIFNSVLLRNATNIDYSDISFTTLFNALQNAQNKDQMIADVNFTQLFDTLKTVNAATQNKILSDINFSSFLTGLQGVSSAEKQAVLDNMQQVLDVVLANINQTTDPYLTKLSIGNALGDALEFLASKGIQIDLSALDSGDVGPLLNEMKTKLSQNDQIQVFTLVKFGKLFDVLSSQFSQDAQKDVFDAVKFGTLFTVARDFAPASKDAVWSNLTQVIRDDVIPNATTSLKTSILNSFSQVRQPVIDWLNSFVTGKTVTITLTPSSGSANTYTVTVTR